MTKILQVPLVDHCSAGPLYIRDQGCVITVPADVLVRPSAATVVTARLDIFSWEFHRLLKILNTFSLIR